MSSKLNTAIAVAGIDIGKNSFHVIGLDKRGAIVLRQKWSRGQVEARLANTPPCLIGMEACVGAHHLSRKLQALGHDARLMPAKYVRPYSKGQKNDFRDAEAIAEAVQRPTMRFVATKTGDQLDLQALHRVRARLVGQRTGIINQIRAFLLERGVAVRQGLRFLRIELPGILAKRTDVLSPRMLHLIEGLADDWHRLDERIEALSSEIGALACGDPACDRLMTVPGIGPIISSATVAAIAICALCSCRQPGSYWSGSGQSIGTAMGSSPGSRLPKNVCTTMCWRSRSPTSLPASPGRFSTRSANSSASGQTRCRPELLECRAVLGPVKAWPGEAGARGKANATASLDGPLRVARQHMRRPGRRNGLQARTKEPHKEEQRNCI